MQRAVILDNRRLRRELGSLAAITLGSLLSFALILLYTLLKVINPLSAVGIICVLSIGSYIAGSRASGSRPRSYEDYEDRLNRVLALEASEYQAVERKCVARRRSGVDEQDILETAERENAEVFARTNARMRAVYDGTDLREPVRIIEATAISSAPTPRMSKSSMPSHPEIPARLLKARRDARLIPFVGAGLSLGSDVKGAFPSWRGVPERLLAVCDEYHCWRDEHDRRSLRSRFLAPDPAGSGEVPRAMPLREMLRELDVVKQKLQPHYGAALHAIFCPEDAAPGGAHKAVMALGARTVLTTNYDQLLEAVEPAPSRQVYVGREASEALAVIKNGRKVLLKVHGSADKAGSVVLTMEEYTQAHRDPAYRKVLSHLMIDNSLLFVGYGGSDPYDLDILLEDNANELQGAGELHFALLQRLSDSSAEAARHDSFRTRYGIMVIPYDDHAQIVPFLQALAVD